VITVRQERRGSDVCRLRTRSWSNAESEAPRNARCWLRETLRQWDAPDSEGELALIVTELVTNSVRHATAPIDVALAVAAGFVEVTVTDRGQPVGTGAAPPLPSSAVPVTARHPSGVPPVRFSDAEAARGEQEPLPVEGIPVGGRGLFIVDALADAWALQPTSRGRRVWVRRRVDEEWPYRSSCNCGPDNPRAVPLASGHLVDPAPLLARLDPPPGLI
jgi:anti-sigma regulatory factor (Ser/Thr protein kinase)